MTDPTTTWFETLGHRRHVPNLQKIHGSVRFDLKRDEQTDYWLVLIDNGDIDVSREKRDADCVVRAGKGFFDQVVSGERNAISALLRADIVVKGELGLLLMLERMLPGPPGARDPREWRKERERGRP